MVWSGYLLSGLGLIAASAGLPFEACSSFHQTSSCDTHPSVVNAVKLESRDDHTSSASNVKREPWRLNLGDIAAVLSGQEEGFDAFDPPAPDPPLGTPKAVYILSNEVLNHVITFGINPDGRLSPGGAIYTGGKGLLITDTREPKPAGSDYLLSQGAIAVMDDILIAVNPGSNTLSIFNIDSKDPTRLTQVGGPVDSMGDVPISVTISKPLRTACVANTGPRSGIACFSFDDKVGLKPLDGTQREITLTPPQSPIPVGPGNMISNIFFNPDSTGLLALVRGDLPSAKDYAPKNRGYVSLFNVVEGKVAMQGILSTPRDISLISGAVGIPTTKNILATDATFGAVIINLAHNGITTTLWREDLRRQPTTSFATYSRFTRSVFVSDPGKNVLTELDQKTGDVLATQNVTNTNPGMTNVVAAGKFVYALSPGNGTSRPAIVVFDASAGQRWAQHIENFEIPGQISAAAHGLGVYLADT